MELLSFHLCFFNGLLGSINAQRSSRALVLWTGSLFLWAGKNLTAHERNVTNLVPINTDRGYKHEAHNRREILR
jgi:hypothetical protein